MEIPPFSDWLQLADRASLPGCEHRGLYIIAKSDTPLCGPANPLVREVIYIGETHGMRMSIRKRLNYFKRASNDGKSKHSGGRRCFRTFGGDLAGLHAACLPVIEIDQAKLEARIFGYEHTLIAAYVDQWGIKPVCNVSGGKGG